MRQVQPPNDLSDTLLSTFSSITSVGSTTTSGTSSTGVTGTTTTTTSSLNPSDTNYGVVSLSSYTGEEIGGVELTPQDYKWVEAAHAFDKTEQPFHEPKPLKSVRKLKVWHPKRPFRWSFLRRLYNGRQDMKEEETANDEMSK